jgi:hypothetical protein
MRVQYGTVPVVPKRTVHRIHVKRDNSSRLKHSSETTVSLTHPTSVDQETLTSGTGVTVVEVIIAVGEGE